MSISKLITWLISIIISLLIIAVIGLVGIQFVNLDKYSEQLSTQLTELTGQHIEFQGQ